MLAFSEHARADALVAALRVDELTQLVALGRKLLDDDAATEDLLGRQRREMLR